MGNDSWGGFAEDTVGHCVPEEAADVELVEAGGLGDFGEGGCGVGGEGLC
jgi:hypothetical protein